MKRVLIIAQLDRYSNGVKPAAIERFLTARGHEVRLVDTYYLSRASGSRSSWVRRLPAVRPAKLALYAVEVASVVLTRRWGAGRRRLTYYVVVADHRIRRAILQRVLPLDEFDLVICETPYDAGALLGAGTATLYDCPTPWADELWYEGRLTPRQHARLRRQEREVFEGTDHLAFYWESYARYAVREYGISGRNLLTLNFGCTPAIRQAKFADPPRIVYLGSLSSRFIDLPLLARLSRIHPHIDVYGGPPPDPDLGLRHLGWAEPDILRDYQLGLITCTRDPLRRAGFSAKHLAYLAHGLPVLVPEWRQNLDLLQGSVTYTEDTFRSVVDTLRDREHWQSLSDAAYAQAQQLTWDRTLSPLETLLGTGHRGGGEAWP